MEKATHMVKIGAWEFRRRFRRRERQERFCRECALWGKQWGCPPFGDDPWDVADDGVVEVIADIIPVGEDGNEGDDWGEMGRRLMREAREPRERWLLEREDSEGGRAFIGVGECTHCGGAPCARITGAACRHPGVVRPSLEGAGFDVEAICRELFALELEWGSGGKHPSRLVLVTAFAHGN